MGTVRPRPSGTWEARWYGTDGKQYSKNLRTKTLARKWVNKMEVAKDRGENTNPRLGKTRFEVIADEWLASTQSRPKPIKPKTWDGYRSVVEIHLKPKFGSWEIRRINEEAIERYIAELSARSLSPASIGNILRVLSPILRRAVRYRYINGNPLTNVEGRPKVEKPSPDDLAFLTPAQVLQLADEIDARYRTLIRLAAFTGARWGELAALRVRSFDQLHGKLTVAESVAEIAGRDPAFGPPKNGKARTYQLDAELVAMLKDQVEGKGDPDAFIFGSRDGTFIRHSNFYGRAFRPTVRRLTGDETIPEKSRGQQFGIWPTNLRKLRFHDLRHTCASILIASGANLKEVQEWLGHANYQITADRYTHLYKGHQNAIVERMTATFKAAAAERRSIRPTAQIG